MLFRRDSEQRFCAYDLPPLEYLGLVDCINQNNINCLKQRMLHLRDNPNQCLAVVGSDGKFERHPQSKTEFVLFQFQSEDNMTYSDTNYDYILNYILTCVLDMKQKSSIDQKTSILEIKTIGEKDDNLLSYTYGDKNTIYPDRTISSFPIWGNTEIYYAARERIISEISSKEIKSRRIRDKMRDQLRQYKNAMETGIFRKQQIFKITNKTGYQYYQESTPLTFGFKAAFIRAVQRKIDIITAASIATGALKITDELISNYPTATCKKLIYLSEQNVIDRETAEQTGIAYAWFLREYHRAQEHYKSKRTPVTVKFNLEEFQYYAEIIKNFVNR